VPLQGIELNEQMQARIALLFALPVMELGAEWLDGFHEILLYPEPFVVDTPWQVGYEFKCSLCEQDDDQVAVEIE